MSERFRRVNVLVEEEQYARIQSAGLNFSGFIRDLITDHFNEKHVALSVSPQTRTVYDRIISNFGASDAELEACLLKALDELLEKKSEDIKSLRRGLKGSKR